MPKTPHHVAPLLEYVRDERPKHTEHRNHHVAWWVAFEPLHRWDFRQRRMQWQLRPSAAESAAEGALRASVPQHSPTGAIGAAGFLGPVDAPQLTETR
jgi:hypothetical protein